jgi:2-oxoglutarate ferredoxin oxidoreductase subunit alpha
MTSQTQELESVVIRFSGDSGDGMQLTGTQFSNTSAVMGNDISTFPDFPAEIRAPQGTVAGVSGFQVHIGSKEINTPGDEADMLVAFNPAALKANLHSLKRGGTLVINEDGFSELNISKAGYDKNPLDDEKLKDYQIIKAPIDKHTLEALKDLDMDSKSKKRCKNFYALGMTYFYYSREIGTTVNWINQKFGKKPVIAEANILALKAGRNFAETSEAIVSSYSVPKATIQKGKYRQINGNTATAWGFIRAAQCANLNLFLGSYPITPASDILHELSMHKEFGVRTFQAEDEIAGICTSIGASLAGDLAITTSSGPGIALKGEAIGLAMMYETPMVIVNVQRGGPSTGLPTKTEQSDLYQAMYGRNGESPLIVVAASRPNDCFEMAFEASRLALEHMTPVMLLTDGYIANGTEPWRINDVEATFNKINHKQVPTEEINEENNHWFTRDEETMSRKNWVIPGQPGGEHRIGGLEKDYDRGNISYDPENHQRMTYVRQQKIDLVANNIPEQEVVGEKTGDLLAISWGGTFGAVNMAVRNLQKEGKKVSHMHLKYINPMPKNVEEIIKGFKNVIVPELNMGQMATILNSKFGIKCHQYNKIMGLPFKISELKEEFNKFLN